MPFAPGDPAFGLAAYGSNVWLLGSVAAPPNWMSEKLARSSDRGRTFVSGPGPWVPGLGGELVPTSARVLWTVCPTGMMAGAWRSTDGGVSFRPLASPGLINAAVLAPASGEVAVLAPNGAPARLLRTADGGVTWRAARRPGRATFWPWIGFTDTRVGAALVQTGASAVQALWRTTDGGASWSRVALD